MSTKPALVTTISCQDFQRRLLRALQSYQEYCEIQGVRGMYQEPIEWLDHFQSFLDLAEIERK